MNELSRALAIMRFYRGKSEYPQPSKIITDLGWEGICSEYQIKRYLTAIYFSFDDTSYYLSRKKLVHELMLVYFFNEESHIRSNFFYCLNYLKERFGWNQVNNECSDSQIRRYLKDLKDAGLPLVTKRGRSWDYLNPSGYRFSKHVNL